MDGPAGSEEAFGDFTERGWGRAATGPVFTPFASVHDGFPPCCGEHLGGDASAQVKVDATSGSAGATAFAQHPGNGELARARGQGGIEDVMVFFTPQFTITMDLIGSVFSNITGDAEGSYGLSMVVSLTADDPSNPDTDFEFYFGVLDRFLDSEGTRTWEIGSTVSGFQSGTGDGPPLHRSGHL